MSPSRRVAAALAAELRAPSGRCARRLAGVAGLVVALALAPSASAGKRAGGTPALTLEALMHGMATTTGVEARFREVKHVSLLTAPVVTRGTLYFVPPDRLLRRTTSPTHSSLRIDGDRIRYRDAAAGEDLDLSDNPVAREFVRNLVVLFNGNLPELRRRYEVAFEANGHRWHLRLVPRAKRVRALLASITLVGRGRALERMELRETDGDRTVTTFQDIAVDRRFSPEERHRLFGAAPSGS